jgi:DNA-binding NarL/FixJ family response regulator
MTPWLSAADGATPCNVDVWNELLAGRVTIVDWFDEGGRRFVVTRRNAIPTRISAVERAVVSWVATGGAQKVIACELGLSPAGVSDALARAIHKLGVADVTELTRVAAALGVTR